MDKWNQPAGKHIVDRTIAALKDNGIDARFVKSGRQAKELVLELIPAGSEVMTMSSTTLDTIGLSAEINKENSKFHPVRDKLYAMDRKTQALEMNRLGAAPEYALGSVHAVTEDGHIMVASNTGSQLPAYAYSALHVIWLVGTQKIVKNTEQGMKRIYEYVLPLESTRANKAYNILTGSFVSKLLVVNREIVPGRVTVIFVGESLGF